MLEQELPEFTEEQALDNKPELSADKKSKIHTPLPFERGGEKTSVQKPTDEALSTDRPDDNEVVVDLRTARQEAEKAFTSTETEETEEGSPEDDHSKFIDSVWHRIEVDTAGHTVEGQQFGEAFYQEQRPENPVELDYADAGATGSDEEEVAVASGQLAVSTLDEKESEDSKLPSGPAFSGSISAVIERLEEMIQNLSQGFGSFTAFDAVLWAVLFLIVIAIIFAVRA